MYHKKSKDQFIKDANKIHIDKGYTYPGEYVGRETPIQIICPIHGLFEQKPKNHLNGTSCPLCSYTRQNKKLEFSELANKKHNNYYDYSKVKYINNYTKVIIICPKHGEFGQKPYSHLLGKGCPVCKSSKGELQIKNFLENKNIEFTPQHTFNDCRGIKNLLPFDFYLPDYNLCIEYQGEQHYMPIKHWGSIEKFEKVKLTDSIKKNYCISKGIKLLEVAYNDNTIQKLEVALGVS